MNSGKARLLSDGDPAVVAVDSFEELFRKELNKLSFGAGPFIVAVSGGADSVALLHLLHRVRDMHGRELHVVHVNHHLRPGSRNDAEFCERVASDLKCPFKSVDIDVSGNMRKHNGGLETVARRLRYRALEQEAFEIGAVGIFLGHHRDDQAETVLANLARGTGLRGLTGMRLQNGLRCRPLLFASRSEIESWLLKNKISFRDDETNRDTSIPRNKIRHLILPWLESNFDADFRRKLTIAADAAGEAEDYLLHESEKALQAAMVVQSRTKIVLEIQAFRAYFTAIQKTAFRLALARLAGQPVQLSHRDFMQMRQAVTEAPHGASFVLSTGQTLHVDRESLVLMTEPEADWRMTCQAGGRVKLPDGRSFETRLLTADTIDPHADSHTTRQFIDAATAGDQLYLRKPRDGDRFQPLGLGGSKTLSDFFTDLKIPLHQRAETIVVENDMHIVWLAGYRIDERCKVTNQTTSILQLTFKDTSE